MNAIAALYAVALMVTLAGPGSAAGLADAPPGATSCSGCHPSGRVDTSVPRLNGRSPADITAAMQAFKSGQTASTVMGRIAKGFSDDEIKAIAAWYGEQKD
jgi:cytochrome subunit of sulfide dehydrogenase